MTHRAYRIHAPHRLIAALRNAFGITSWDAICTIMEARHHDRPNVQRLAREDIQVALRVARR